MAVSRVTIRPARPGDIDALVQFSAAMAQETEGRSLDRSRLRAGTRAVLQNPARGFYLVAVVHGGGPAARVVAQLLVTFEWSDWRNATFWWIQSVYVAEPWRRRGIYRKMHEAVLARAWARRDVCGVRLYVEQHNRVAQTVYRKVGLRRTPYVIYEDDFILRARTDGSSKRKAR